MTALRKQQMGVDEFLRWAEGRPDRWELIDGAPLPMSPERVIHGDTKYRVARALERSIEAARIPCRFVLDSAAVKIDATNSFQPDVMVYCGEAVGADALIVPNPVIVVEALSPNNAMRDLRDKLAGYFRLTSVVHYLIVDPDKRLVIHHARGEGDAIVTRIVTQGRIALAPPGINIEFRELFDQDTCT
jgi:Uma2 family endonuclease